MDFQVTNMSELGIVEDLEKLKKISALTDLLRGK
jgi:hypothetical protein